MARDEEIVIHADMVINAAGAWAGQIAHMAGIPVTIIPGKGVMVAMNHRVVNTVLNRCKMPADGDIIVPIHTVAVIGTTDTEVADPERLQIEPWEVQRMLDEGDKLVPDISRPACCAPGQACARSTRRISAATAATPRVRWPCSTTPSAMASKASSPSPAASGRPSA